MRVIHYWRVAALVLVMLVPLALIMAVNPIAQDPLYHIFADARTCLGIPNFFNVASNLAFLLVGLAGLWLLRAGAGGGATLSWRVFFLGIALVSVGSGYYHSVSNNATLVWDRLPMTVAFMALFAAFVSEHVGARWERILLAAAVATGIASIAWWHYTDDLRPYVWVQLAPFFAILLLLAVYPGRYTCRIYLLYGVAFYALAKAVEFYDQELYALTSLWLSGHSLKHLLAAVAALFVYLMLRRRAALPTPGK